MRGFEKISDRRDVLQELKSALAALLPRLRRFGIMLTGSASDGDDLAQAACLRALERFDQLRVEARLDSWVYGIMRNLWADERRARSVRRHDEIEAAAAVVGDEGETIAEGRLTMSAVRRALAELPAEQRTVLTLVCVDGLSYKEAAAVLNVPIGTVMSRLARGRQGLHNKLAGSGENHAVLPMERRR